MTLLPLERYLNWENDPAPLPTQYHGNLTSPAPSESQENTPPQDASRKLPRRLRPRRRREKQPVSSTNDNSAFWKTGTGSQTANRDSAFQGTGSATRPRSTAYDNSAFPGAGNRPGISRSMRSTPVEHPRTFLRPQHSQSPRFWTNQNAGRRFEADHPEFPGVYKPGQTSIQQDSANRLRRDSFSGSGLSSPALQRSHRDSFSELPFGQLNKEISLTDSNREARIAGGSRPGIIYPLPRSLVLIRSWSWTLPHLELLPLAVLNGLPRSWTSWRLDGWRILAAQNHPRSVDRARPGATHANGPGIALLECTGRRSAPHTAVTGVNSSLLPWYKQGIIDELV